jgi:hypothetical protein
MGQHPQESTMTAIRRRLAAVAALVAALSVSLPAAAETLAKQEEALARFQQFAGEPLKKMPSFRLTDWRPLGKTHVAVFRGPTTAWLLTLRDPCIGLDWARSIAITSTGGTVSPRFDRVVFRDGIGAGARREDCRIEEIRAVDYRKVRDAEKAARAANAGG